MMKAQVMAEKETIPADAATGAAYIPPEPEELWARYYPRLSVYVRIFAPFRYEDVQDLVQDIFVKIFSALDRYNPGYTLNTWVYTIARNHCLDALRKRRGERRMEEKVRYFVAPDKEETGPEGEYLRNEAMAEIRNFIEGLEERDRQVCFLRFYEKMKLTEIAEITGEPEGTVKYRSFQIREKLRQQMKDYFSFGDDNGR